MRDSRRLLLPWLAVAAVVVLAVVGARRTATSAEGAAGPPGISAADRAATFHFAPPTAGPPPAPPPSASAPGRAAVARGAVLAAVARARPPARRLVGLVDGLTDVRVGPTGS